MPPIIKHDTILDDAWLNLSDDAPIEPGADLIVSLGRLLAERDALRAAARRIGVRINGEDDPWSLRPLLAEIELIAIEFPKFTDGRGYSLARILREHLGWGGPLRATGDVLRDQLMHMRRVGFDEFVVRPDKSIEDALKAFTTFSVTYGEKQAM